MPRSSPLKVIVPADQPTVVSPVITGNVQVPLGIIAAEAPSPEMLASKEQLCWGFGLQVTVILAVPEEFVICTVLGRFDCVPAESVAVPW
jgi:hypothetical protein